jgi:hypothetical protein
MREGSYPVVPGRVRDGPLGVVVLDITRQDVLELAAADDP